MPAASLARGRIVLERWKLLGEKLRRRAAGQLAEVPVQGRLVEVAARGGDLSDGRERRRVPQHRRGPVEPQQPGRELGAQPELLAEAPGQVLAAPADVAGEIVDCGGPARSHEG